MNALRAASELRLERGVPRLRAELHVVEILRAPGIAVGEQDLLLRRSGADRCERRVRQQRGAGRRAESAPEQQVAIAVHQEHAHAVLRQRAQLRGDFAADGVIIVVASPVLEEIAENHEFLELRRDVLHEARKRRVRGGLRGVQVQVGDEDRRRQVDAIGLGRESRYGRRHGRCAGHSTTSALVMTTSASGTSWCMP